MANIIEITDYSDPQLDCYARLTEAQLRNRLEPEKGIFIAESPKVILRALGAGYEPLSLLMERKKIDGPAKEVVARCGDLPLYTADRAVLEGLTGYEVTRGVLCAMRRPVLPTVEELCANARRVAVLEGIVDSTNVGAIFRSAAALHMDAVLVTPTCCDPLYRRAARVSMGTVFQIPWTRIGDDPSQWPQPGLSRLNALGFKTVAMALSDTAISIEDPRGGRPQRGGGQRRGLLGAAGPVRNKNACDHRSQAFFEVSILQDEPFTSSLPIPQNGRIECRGGKEYPPIKM